MKCLAKNFVAAALPLALTACGGGGSDNATADNTPTSTYSVPSTTQQTISAPSTTSQAATSEYHIGAYYEYTNGVKLPAWKTLGIGNDLNTIVGNTRIIAIPSASEAHQKIGNILVYGSTDGRGALVSSPNIGPSYRSFQMSDDSYRYSRIGFLNNASGYTLFNIGSFTYRADLPSSGQALYRGDALVTYRNSAYQFTNIERGSVAANINFGTKTGTISLQAPSYAGQVNITINDEAALFSDTESSSSSKGAYGAFNGPTGEELSGNYYDIDVGLDSVFAAKRQ